MIGPRFSLRTLQARFLAALMVIGVVPLALVGLGEAVVDHRAIAAQSSRELVGLARGLAGQLDIYLAGMLSDTRAIAAVPDTVSMDVVRQEALLREMFQQYPVFSRLWIVDRYGQQLASSHSEGWTPVTADRSFQAAVERGQQMWEIGVERETGQSAVIIHAPIRNAERKIIGAVGAAVTLESLAANVTRVPVGGGGRVSVLDGGGRVLLHQDRTLMRTGTRPPQSTLPLSARPAGPNVVRYELDGVTWIAGYAPTERAGWTAVVERPESEVLAPAEGSWRIALAGIGVSSSLALVVAVWLARSLTRPVRDLVVAARALGEHDTAAPLPVVSADQGELGILVEAFAAMRHAVLRREEALRDGEASFHLLFASSPQAMWVYDRETLQFLEVNEVALARYGYTRDEFRQMRITDICATPGIAGLLEEEESGRSGLASSSDRRHRLKDGRSIDVEIACHGLEFAGRPAVLVVATDVTERKRAEAEICRLNADLEQRVAERTAELASANARVEQERATLAAVMAGMTDGLVVLDADRRIRYWNDQADALLDGALNRQAGESIADLIGICRTALADPAALAATWVQALGRIDERPTLELNLVDPRSRDVVVQLFPVEGLTNGESGIGLLLRDVTGARALERTKDELISVVSHELRTPLASLVGFAELMLIRDLPEDKRRQALTVMTNEGRRLTALLNDFLDLQRMESGHQPLRTEPTSVPALLVRAVATAGEDPARPIVLAVPPDLPPVLADAERVQQVLANLICNARKYSPGSGEVRLAALSTGEGVELSVRDHGLGLPPDALPRLFQKFYRVDNSDWRSIKGTGLGLAICRNIVEAHGGRIWAESAGLGQGARFCFTLPFADLEWNQVDGSSRESDSGAVPLWDRDRLSELTA
ncbi:MAG: PAS domain S-box protein [Chloroflexi bacterium]|nr:PAS domain S-box protein [Chloroflexota bacterium]